jgi:hypothetical protein
LTHPVKQFAVADPRDFEGDPFEVAERALLQAAGLAELLRSTLDSTRLMFLNADLERQLMATSECVVAEFENSLHARKFDAVAASVEEDLATLRQLAKAAAFNPKKVK